MSKPHKKPKLHPRDIYGIAEECVRGGLPGGWNKAHKHVEDPDKDLIFDCQREWIMMLLSERFDWDLYT